MFELKMTSTDPAHVAAAEQGGQPLIALCREEADSFDKYLRSCGIPMYEDGLAKFEHEAIAGYLYQKLRGRLEPEKAEPQDLPESKEGQSGSP